MIKIVAIILLSIAVMCLLLLIISLSRHIRSLSRKCKAAEKLAFNRLGQVLSLQTQADELKRRLDRLDKMIPVGMIEYHHVEPVTLHWSHVESDELLKVYGEDQAETAMVESFCRELPKHIRKNPKLIKLVKSRSRVQPDSTQYNICMSIVPFV